MQVCAHSNGSTKINHIGRASRVRTHTPTVFNHNLFQYVEGKKIQLCLNTSIFMRTRRVALEVHFIAIYVMWKRHFFSCRSFLIVSVQEKLTNKKQQQRVEVLRSTSGASVVAHRHPYQWNEYRIPIKTEALLFREFYDDCVDQSKRCNFLQWKKNVYEYSEKKWQETLTRIPEQQLSRFLCVCFVLWIWHQRAIDNGSVYIHNITNK